MVALAFRASVFMATASAGAPITRKRGFSGFLGNFTCQDAALLGLDDSWHYSWMTTQSQKNHCGNQKITSEFVPMVNGINQATKHLTDDVKTRWTANNAHYLLGYNEPDYGNGHNHPHMATPADAAADWPDVQALAAMFDPPLELIAPGVASGAETGGTDAWDADGRSTWLDEFFGNCTEVVEACDPSLIKYIAMHDYQGDVTKLRRRVSGAAVRYNRKLWITEIAITKYGAPPGRDQQDAFMEELLPFLDSNDDVFRYAWFSARNAPNKQNGGSNLLPPDGSSTPTTTGKIYMSNGNAGTALV